MECQSVVIPVGDDHTAIPAWTLVFIFEQLAQNYFYSMPTKRTDLVIWSCISIVFQSSILVVVTFFERNTMPYSVSRDDFLVS